MITKGRISEALEVLKITHESETKAIAELNSIRDLLNEQANQKEFTFKEFTEPWMKRVLLLGVTLAIIMQTTGVNAIMFYGSHILITSGFSTDAALVGNICNGIISVVGTVIGFYLVRKLTRRGMLARGLLGTTLSNFL